MGAIIRHNEKRGYIAVLCPMGHLLESHELGRGFAGSSFEAELAYRHEGDRFDRLAAKCQGAGHPEPGSMIGHNHGPDLTD